MCIYTYKYTFIYRSQKLEIAFKIFFDDIPEVKGGSVNILAVYQDKILVSRSKHRKLYIYEHQKYKSTIPINGEEKLYDATWTPGGNIMYTTHESKQVVVISESGKFISKSADLAKPRLLSISYDKIIYLADFEKGVFESTNDDSQWFSDSVRWRFIFKPTNELWCCWQVIKVENGDDNSDVFWTLERSNLIRRLRVYEVDKKRPDINVIWDDDGYLQATDGKSIDLAYSSLLHDENKAIYLSEYTNAVYKIFVEDCQLMVSDHIKNDPRNLVLDVGLNEPWRLAKDKNLLYVGQRDEVVAYKLTNAEKK